MGVFRKETLPSGARLVRPSSSNPRIPVTSPYNVNRSLTASAQKINLTSQNERTQFARRRQAAEGWQNEAWQYFDQIGEIKYAFTLVANTLSRVRLYAGYVEDPYTSPAQANTETQAGASAIRVLSQLDSAFGGQAGLLRDAALNLCVTGECILTQRPANIFTKTPESWDIRSTDELKVTADGKVVINASPDQGAEANVLLPENAFMARIWRPHPRYSDASDSSMLGVLDACAELQLLNRTFRSTARSRLNSGMLYLPDGLSAAATEDPDTFSEDTQDPEEAGTFTPGGTTTDTVDASDMDEIEEALIEAMTTPIADESSAAAVVPLILRGPAELGEKIQLIKFERSFDSALTVRADRVLERIMQGLDIPKEIVQGVAGLKYANALVIDQVLYTSHIEPLALLICDALTSIYLRPSLIASGIDPEEAKKYVVWYDASDVTTRPNKAEDANEGFQNMLISGETWRKTHNFTDDDAPTPTEIALRLLLDKGPISPELAESLLRVVAPDIMEAVLAANQANSPAPLSSDVLDALSGQPVDPNTTNVQDSAAQPPTTPASPPEPGSTPTAPPPAGGSGIQATPLNPEDLV